MAPSRRRGKSSAAAARRQWKVGDLVLAKVKGFPAWPATVSEPAKWGYSTDWKKVLVYFFGTKQIAFCNPADVEAFTEEKKNSLLIKRQGKGADFVRAVEEIIDSYEKAKKQDQDVEFNSGDEGTVSNTGNSEGSGGKSWMNGQTQNPMMMSNSHSESLNASKDSNESCNPIVVPVSTMDITELQGMETVSEERMENSLFLTNLRETSLETNTALRKRLRETQLQGCFVQRRAPSIRRSRSSLKVDPCKFQSFIRPLNGCSKTAEFLAHTSSLDEPSTKKRMRKSLDPSVRQDVDSLLRFAALASNGSSEDNGSEVVATNSDIISLNEGSTLESSCKVEQHETLGCLERAVELNERLDLQSNTVVLKKRRKPNRKRVIQDAAECTPRPDKEASVGAGIIITVQNSPCEKLDERSGKGDGDEHLPLLKRARVRMGKPSREEELVNSMHTEEKPSEGDFVLKTSKNEIEHENPMNTERKPTKEVLVNNSEQVSASTVCYDNCSVGKTSLEAKGAMSNSSPLKNRSHSDSSPLKNCSHSTENGITFWKAKKYQWCGGSLDGEAALPPSKRLHRALEAMSANAAEDDQAGSEAPETTKMLSSSSSDLSPCHFPGGNEVQNALERQNMNFSDTSRCAASFTSPINEGQMEYLDMKACDHIVSSSTSSRQGDDAHELFGEGLNVENSKDLEDSSVDTEIVKPDVDVRSSQPCSSNFDEKQDSLVPKLDRPSSSMEEDKNMIVDTGKKCFDYTLGGEGCPHADNAGNENCSIHQEQDSISEAKEVGNFSALNGTDVLLSAPCVCGEEMKSLKSPTYGNNSNNDMCEAAQVVRHKQTQEGLDASPCSTPMKVLIAAAQAKRHLSRSFSLSDHPLDNKVIGDAVSISSPSNRFESAEQVSPSKTSSSHVHALNNRIDICNSAGSPDVLPHHKKTEHLLDVEGKGKFESTVSRQKSFGKWSVHAEANAARKSFELMLETLSRTKESIGRATRLAIDCAKYGIAFEVVDILARNLESESSLHRRVDLFFLVDSITQCSRGQKGVVGDVYLSAVQAALSRLLSAAAPPGNSARENRKQCMKVLRLWLERKTLPESIIRYHMRELDSIADASVTSVFARRPSRSERALNDPIREMEGMLVDEYGSNTSFQLPGFNMPQMLKNEEEGSDSDEKNFEAVTPEHEPAVPLERETASTSLNDKHRHILEDVDGELEMEDVAPCCEVELNSIHKGAGVDAIRTSHCQLDQHIPLPFAPPLPEDVPPTPPPLPTSPPPVAPLPPPHHPPLAIPRAITDSGDSSHYSGAHNIQNHFQQSVAQQSGSNGMTLESVPYFTPRYSDLPISMHKPSSSSGSHDLPGSHPSTVHPANIVPQTNGAPMDNKAYRLLPPQPMSSNQFSYVQGSQNSHSWRESSCSSFTKKFQVIQDINGDFFAGRDTVKLASHEIGDGGRLSAPGHSGSAYFDKAEGSYTTVSSYYGPPREPARIPNSGWAFPPRALNYRHSTPSVRPPEEALSRNIYDSVGSLIVDGERWDEDVSDPILRSRWLEISNTRIHGRLTSDLVVWTGNPNDSASMPWSIAFGVKGTEGFFYHKEMASEKILHQILWDTRAWFSGITARIPDNSVTRDFFFRWDIKVEFTIRCPSLHYWLRPPSGCIAINCDGSVNDDRGGYGAMARDSMGIVIFAMAEGSSDANILRLELGVVRCGLYKASSLKLPRVHIRLDSFCAIHLIKGSFKPPWHYLGLLDDIQSLTEEFTCCTFAHVVIEVNSCVDILVSFIRSDQEVHLSANCLPSTLSHLVGEDSRGRKYQRINKKKSKDPVERGKRKGRRKTYKEQSLMGSSQSIQEHCIHEFTVQDSRGKDVDLNMYKGKVLLVVNVASKCGLTDSNYTELTELYTKYKDKGLEILAFPCNQFLYQEPGTGLEAETFACTRYKAEYPVFQKVCVNGPETTPVYKFLKASKPGGTFGSRIKWNFTKFLVDKEGHVVNRYAPTTAPLSIEQDINKVLGFE
ncbi:protein HUA2-LIKE 3-like [Telopea speciosissima]|uniref:protein HUA2-LIKE 3-like n=1 Tax=Telopea speciosissima TaxID=54955 RepID=UPI001CC65FF5|nr:protein HUA2-LIKE 3-like [Telopea speciosissima]